MTSSRTSSNRTTEYNDDFDDLTFVFDEDAADEQPYTNDESEDEDEPDEDENELLDVPVLDIDAETEDDVDIFPFLDRDEDLEAEVEAEAVLPVERIIDDISIADPVRQYLREIGQHPLLTGDQEVAIAKRIRAGQRAEAELKELATAADVTPAVMLASLADDQRQQMRRTIDDGLRAQQELSRSNLRLVVSVAKRYIGRGMSFLDLIQEGNLGLLRAVEKFDYELGFKFSTYATWWIRQSISRAIADQARTIRIPVHMVENINRLLRVQRRLMQELGREPTAEEVAVEMDFIESEDEREAIRLALKEGRPLDAVQKRTVKRAAAKVRKITRVSQEPMSLEMPVGNEDSSSLGDFIEDESLPAPADVASNQLLKEQMQEILEQLSDRERKVLELRFGLNDGMSHTLEEVGQEFGVTRERIRQIEAKALRKLRHPIRSRKLRDYLS